MQAADVTKYLSGRPRRTGRVWVACFLLTLDFLILPIWGMWIAGAAQGSGAVMTLMGRGMPWWLAVSIGPMVLLSVVAVWLAADLRGFRYVVGVALLWIPFTTAACAAEAADAAWLIEHIVIVALLLSGRVAFSGERGSAT